MKLYPSVAIKIAAIFALSIAAVVMLFSASATILMRQTVVHQQNNEIQFFANKIAMEWSVSENDNVRFENNLNIPYYLSYTVFSQKDSEVTVLSSNNQFLPVFADTDGKILKYTDEDYFIDGRLALLYFVTSVNEAVELPKKNEIPDPLGAEINEGGRNNTDRGFSNKIYNNRPNILFLTKPTQFDFNNVFVQVSIDVDRDTSKRMINTMPLIFLIAAIPLLILSFLLALYFVRRLLKPVSDMTLMAQKIGSENLDAHLPRNQSGDEFDILAKTFNELFERLDADFKRERQFTSDVSHELKTPLAVISGHANMLRRWGKDDPEQLSKSIKTITAESKNMQSIIENLLELSHVENGQISVKMSSIAVRPLFERLANEVQVFAPEVHIEIDVPKELNNISVVADENMLHEVLTILLTNSVRYSKEPAHIILSIISLESIGNNNEITNANFPIGLRVTDDGCGVSSEALPHIFERFYREDAAHTRNVKTVKSGTSGSGLGLAIAKALISVMNAQIDVESPLSSSGGTCVTLKFSEYTL
ncbi:MAG: hypothetical protein BKP49_05560 [Treponema sp. CETP13]|nr:MAG: hypothetical protein BKP49_05560 [Treponema sp. CETP13]